MTKPNILFDTVMATLAERQALKDAADPFIVDAVRDALTSAARLIDPMLNVPVSSNEEFAAFWAAFRAMTPLDFYKRGVDAGRIDGIVSAARHRAEVKAHEARVAAEVPEPQKVNAGSADAINRNEPKKKAAPKPDLPPIPKPGRAMQAKYVTAIRGLPRNAMTVAKRIRKFRGPEAAIAYAKSVVRPKGKAK